jgi:hypothetical protein
LYNLDDRTLRIAALLAAGVLGAWTAWTCHRAQQRGVPGSDALVWASLAAVFVIYAQVRLARDLGWLQGWGGWLRMLARQYNFYADRRSFQVFVTVVVAVIVVALLLYGVIWFWHYIKRYRLAIGFASFAIGYAFIRFVSLHEVDSWNAAHPWAPVAAELIAAAGASAVAITRLRQLSEFARFWDSG